MKTSLTEEKWKQFEQPLFGRLEFFQRWQLKLNNHSAMAVGKFFLRFLFNLKFILFYDCFPLDFIWKWYEIEL